MLETENKKPDGPYDVEDDFIRKKSKQKKKENADMELAATLKASLESREKREAEAEGDSDRLFLLSLLPYLKKIPENEKLTTRLELMNVINKKLQIISANNRSQTCQPNFTSSSSHRTPFGSSASTQLAQNFCPQYTDQSMQIPRQSQWSQNSSSVETDTFVTSPESTFLELF